MLLGSYRTARRFDSAHDRSRANYIKRPGKPSQPNGLLVSGPVLRVWLYRYVLLVIIGFAVIACVGFCAALGEMETLKWKLETAVSKERSRQVSMVREINCCGRWANLASVAAQRDFVTRPAGVIEIDATRPLPDERLTVLVTPQPFRSRDGWRMQHEQPSEAGVGGTPP